MNLFLDVLLNNTLLNGKSFKIIAVFIHADDTELKHLANIMSFYSVPIIPIMPTKKSYIRSIQRIYKYYDNVLLLHFTMNTERPVFLENLTAKFNAKLITIFYSSEDPQSADYVSLITQYLKSRSSVCANLYQITYEKYQENLDAILTGELSNIYVTTIRDYKFSLKVIEYLNRKVNKNTVIVLYNYNASTAEKLDKALLNITTNKLQIFVLKDMYPLVYLINFHDSLMVNIYQIGGLLTNISKQSPTEHTFSVAHRSTFNYFLSNIKYYFITYTPDLVTINNIDVHLLNIRNVYLLNIRNDSQEFPLFEEFYEDFTGTIPVQRFSSVNLKCSVFGNIFMFL